MAPKRRTKAQARRLAHSMFQKASALFVDGHLSPADLGALQKMEKKALRSIDRGR